MKKQGIMIIILVTAVINVVSRVEPRLDGGNVSGLGGARHAIW